MVWIEKICVDFSLNTQIFHRKSGHVPNVANFELLCVAELIWLLLTIMSTKSQHITYSFVMNILSLFGMLESNRSQISITIYFQRYFSYKYSIYFSKIENLNLPFFWTFHEKTFFRWVIIFCKIVLWSWKCYEKIRLYL